MLRSLLLLCFVFSISFDLSAQEVVLENTFEIESMKKDSYLGDVSMDEETSVTSLVYVRKEPFKIIFTTYRFDSELNYMDESESVYTFGDALQETIAEIREAFSWFEYNGEVIEREIVGVGQGFGGKINVSRILYTETYNWNFGLYFPKWEVIEKMQVQDADGDRYYLYDRFSNEETGEVVMLVGIKAPKGASKGNKFQHMRKFQLLTINADFELVEGEVIEFEHNMGISFSGSLTDPGNRDYDLGGNDGWEPGLSLAGNTIGIYFTPVKGMLAKSFQSEDPGAHRLVILNSEGKIESSIDVDAPTSGWVIQDIVVDENSGDVFFYGPAKDEAYVNNLMPMNSPTSGRGEVRDIKYKNFQIMKITAGYELAWINSTNLDEFQLRAVNPPSQSQSPDYKGKDFSTYLTFVSSSGELFITGQKYKDKKVTDSETGQQFSVVDAYKDLVMFHFDPQGELKAQYGVRRDRNNQYSKGQLTPQYLYESWDGKQVYWIYGEIQGMRKGFEILPGVTVSKRKLLFYPTMAIIDMEAGAITDFIPYGQDAKGKQVYYTNPEFPQYLTPDGNHLIFIGEDKKGKLLWMVKVELN